MACLALTPLDLGLGSARAQCLNEKKNHCPRRCIFNKILPEPNEAVIRHLTLRRIFTLKLWFGAGASSWQCRKLAKPPTKNGIVPK